MTDQTDKAQVTEKKWDIWRPNKNNRHWKPDEQTYAVETDRGWYNSDTHDKIDQAISISAYESLKHELEAVKAELENAKSFNGQLILKIAKLVNISQTQSFENYLQTLRRTEGD